MNNEDYKVIDHEFPNQVIEFLEDRIYEYNSALLGKNDGKLFSKIIKDENDSIIAGISGWTWANACEITLLWIKDDHRTKGYGQVLLNAAEANAKKENCKTILLRTYDFQAPLFYQKHGYTIEY